MGNKKLKVYSYEDVEKFIDNYNEDGYLGSTRYCRLFRGWLPPDSDSDGVVEPKEVTIKIWLVSDGDPGFFKNNLCRFRDEFVLLRNERMSSNPAMPKLIAYCRELKSESAAVVYDFKSYGVLQNLIPSDGFGWLQRIKVALAFAKLVEFLHNQPPPLLPCQIGDISAYHIMLDENFNPILVDFGMATGGLLPDRIETERITTRGFVTDDVFAYGVVLLCLITKRFATEEIVKEDGSTECHKLLEWAQDECNPESDNSFVHQSLAAEPIFCHQDGFEITKLAMQCVGLYPNYSLKIEEVVQRLLKLSIVQSHAKEFGINHMVCNHKAPPLKQSLSGVTSTLLNRVRLFANGFCNALLAASRHALNSIKEVI